MAVEAESVVINFIEEINNSGRIWTNPGPTDFRKVSLRLPLAGNPPENQKFGKISGEAPSRG